MATKLIITVVSQTLTGCLPEFEVYREVEGLSGLDAFKQELGSLIDDHLPIERRVTSSKPVIVLGVDQSRFSFFSEGQAESRPANGLFSQPVEVDQEFPSARAASVYLGLKNNEVALYLNKVCHLPPEERVAVLRGVSLQYLEDRNAALLANLRD